MKSRSCLNLVACGLLCLLATPVLSIASDGAALSGTVGNAATGNTLAGARVELPSLHLAVLTDHTGRFVFNDLPAGSHAVIASYLGLDPVRVDINLAAGQRAVQNFALTTGIYQMPEFVVTGDREGAAAAITAQRNADNVKNIVAMDSFGNLPNLSAGEVAIRLPGVAGELDAEGNVTAIVVRGMPNALNTVTVDGGLVASEGGRTRSFPMSILSGALFEQVELTKGLTPDRSAASMGGTLDLRTRSPLGMRERRRITYNLGMRLAPSFAEHIPMRAGHRSHPLLNAGYQEVFGVFGGDRNLGLAVNLFYSENVNSPFLGTRDFQNTTATPAYLWDYRTADRYNNRKQASANVRFDYRLTPTTTLRFSTLLADNNEPYQRRLETRAYTSQSVGTTGTAGILPGYTDRITQVRATTSSIIDVTGGVYGFYQRLRNASLGAEHDFGRLRLDGNALYSGAHINATNGKAGAALTNRLANVGWILDRTESDLYPRFIQTAGPDVTNPANYRPIANGLTKRNNDQDHDLWELQGNALYALPGRWRTQLKTGFHWREQEARDVARDRRWSYTGSTALPADPSLVTWDQKKTGRRIPQWEPAAFIAGENPANPAWWSEDVYYRESTLFTGRRAVTETVTAGYVMAQGRVGRTSLLAGVRGEETEVESWGWVRPRVGSTTAEQAADPTGAARRDFAQTRRELRGTYSDWFPSAHLTHDLTANLRARLSWSNGCGRPSLNNALPNETANATAQTLTVNNAGLRPQLAESWDVTLDYYFEPVGNLSVGWFHKEIRDYIVSGILSGTVATGVDNGYNGDYGGYTLLTTANAGTALVQGWEVGYQQQFTFLPGVFKGLGLSANYTWLATHGNFGGAANLTSGEVAGFIPRTGNLGLSWSYRGLSLRVLVNRTSDYITSYSRTALGRNQYRLARTSVNLGVAYRLRPALSLTCDIANLFNEPQRLYRGIPDQMSNILITGTTLTLGITGRF